MCLSGHLKKLLPSLRVELDHSTRKPFDLPINVSIGMSTLSAQQAAKPTRFLRLGFAPLQSRLLYQHPEAAVPPCDRKARLVSRPPRSIQSDGWLPGPRRCRRGSTRRTGCNPSIGARSGTSPYLRTLAYGRIYPAGRSVPNDWLSPGLPRTGSSACPSRWDTRS